MLSTLFLALIAVAPSPAHASEAVLRVTIGHENVTGVVVSKEGYVVTTAKFIAERCGECVITVHDDGQRHVSRSAVVAAIDRDNDLALLKADGPFPAEAVFGNDARTGQEISTFSYATESGRTRWTGTIVRLIRVRFPREDGRVVFWERSGVIERVSEPGATGAGAFSSDGKFIGLVVGNTATASGDAATQMGVIRPASAIKAFVDRSRPH